MRATLCPDKINTAQWLEVMETAHRVGYRQPAQFAKAFRRHHGLAPSDFRASRRFAAASAPVEGIRQAA